MGELYIRKVIVDVLPPTGEGKRIDGLRVRFKCEKSNESNPNNAEVEIFNLSEQTRSMFEAKNTRVSLAIGYLGLSKAESPQFVGPIDTSSNVEVVFIGDVTKAAHKKKHDSKSGHTKAELGPVSNKQESQDIITKVQLADGGNKYRNARVDKGYPPNTKLKDVLNDVLGSVSLGLGPLNGIPDVNFANGLTLSGLARDHLDTLTATHKLEWSIQDENIQIIPELLGIAEGIIYIDSNSGLVGIPEKTDKGVEFTSLIQPRFKPGKQVQIKSRFINGTFKIRKVTHQGDSYKGNFLSKVEATS